MESGNKRCGLTWLQGWILSVAIYRLIFSSLSWHVCSARHFTCFPRLGSATRFRSSDSAGSSLVCFFKQMLSEKQIEVKDVRWKMEKNHIQIWNINWSSVSVWPWVKRAGLLFPLPWPKCHCPQTRCNGIHGLTPRHLPERWLQLPKDNSYRWKPLFQTRAAAER